MSLIKIPLLVVREVCSYLRYILHVRSIHQWTWELQAMDLPSNSWMSLGYFFIVDVADSS